MADKPKIKHFALKLAYEDWEALSMYCIRTNKQKQSVVIEIIKDWLKIQEEEENG